MDVDSMTVKELKQELKSRGLKVSGNKAQLKQRLSEAFEEETISTENHDATIADFEEYINDEFERLENDKNNKQQQDDVNIDDIINKNNASIDQHEEEKDLLLQTDFAINNDSNHNQHTITPQQAAPQEIISDFAEEESIPNAVSTSDDPKALNHKDKVQDRMNRFGTTPLTADKDKIESRKRRFAAMNGEQIESPPTKKQKIDLEAEKQKILKRAEKFGTDLPANFTKLTKEEIEAAKIERAKRFGTEHLLPSNIQNAQFKAKKAERMKRFNTNEQGKVIGDGDGEQEVKPKNIIKAGNEPDGSTKLMERKLRFGTLTEADKKSQRQQRFGGDGGNDKKGGGVQQKKFSQRQFRNNQRFERFRQYKKNKGQLGGRGGGRGRGRRGGYGGYNNNNGNNTGGGYRRGGFRGGRGRGRGYNNRGRGQQRHTPIKFSADEQAKINQRKMRFSAKAGSDF